jgi:CDP-paratose 2-epimerase
MSNILITGGCGFVGSNIALHLARSLDPVHIVCMDNLYRKGSELNVSRLQNQGITFHKGDVRDPSSFPAEAFDLLIECSAEPSVLAGQNGSPHYLVSTNLIGLYQCLEVCRRNGSRLIFLSTSRVYPVARLEAHRFCEQETRFVWADEGTPGISARGVCETLDLTGARSLYGFTKLAGEQLIEEYRAAFRLEAVINRCSIIAGPWQFGKVDQGVIALWVMAHLFGRPLSYIGYGGFGKQVRDVLHVDDLCRLIEMQVRDFRSWEGWLGNIAGGLDNSVSLCELTALCRRITGQRVPVGSEAETRPFDLRLFIGDCERLFSRTSWRPQCDVAHAVEDTARWGRDNRVKLERLNC